MKIVVNRCHGGFGLSKAAYKELGIKWDGYGHAEKYREDRSNPKLVACVKKLGKKANGNFADLQIVEIPDDVKEWDVEEYDGREWVSERHRTW